MDSTLLLLALTFMYFWAHTHGLDPYLQNSVALSKTSFPKAFIFGAASSAYQIEGAAHTNGRKPSIWDTFTNQHSEIIEDHSNGDTAEDFYHRYKEDISLMKEIGLKSFRFSISWSRILPYGRTSKGVNQEGVNFYNSMIDELLSNGIEPFITLFHWDLPQVLEDEYGGFLNPKIVDDYGDYVKFCFEEFGDRVKYWATINEPNYFSCFGYAYGINAPGRCSNYIHNCTAGNSATEPYIVMHNMLLCHATAVRLYRQMYQDSHKGNIGIVLTSFWKVPKFQTSSSKKAASRGLDFTIGWILHPITYGDYPMTMREIVGNRLPKFTKEESKMIKGSIDFVGVNYYTARYVDAVSTFSTAANLSYTTDNHVIESTQRNGIPIGQQISRWIYLYPKGLQDVLVYIDKKYKHPPIIITENGMQDNSSMPIKDALNDTTRIMYHYLHLSYLLQAIKEGVDVRGYYVWSFLDDFEWSFGYTVRFGLTYINYKNNLQRIPKASAFWFQNFLQNQNVTIGSNFVSSQ